MQDGIPLHIAHCRKQLRRRHFGNERIISRQFSTAWPLRPFDLNPWDFWLWRYFKFMVYRDPITSLSDFKESIERHMCNIPQFLLLSSFEHAILRFQMVVDNGGYLIDHVLYRFVDYLYVFNKPMICHLGVFFWNLLFFPSMKFQ